MSLLVFFIHLMRPWWKKKYYYNNKSSELLNSSVLKVYLTFKLKCPDNLLTPMSSKMFMYFFLQSKINQGFWWKYSTNDLHIVDL